MADEALEKVRDTEAEPFVLPVAPSARAMSPEPPAPAPTPKNSDSGADLAELTGGTSLDKLTGTLTDIKKREVEAKSGTYDAMEAQLTRDQQRAEAAYKRSAGASLNDLKPWDAAAESKKHHTDPLEAFGSAGAVFAAVASLFTRQPMENAMFGIAAAMEAVKVGDEKAYDRSYSAWQDNTKIALDRHKIQHEAYTDALQLMNTNMAVGRAKMQVQAARFDDQKSLALLEAGMDKELIELQNARELQAIKIADARTSMITDNIKLKDLMSSGFDPKKPSSPESVDAIEGWKRRWAAPSRAALKPEQEFTKRWWEEHPNASTEEFTAAYKQWHASTGGRTPVLTEGRQKAAEIERRKAEYVASGMDATKAHDKATQEVNRAGTVMSGNRADDLKQRIDMIDIQVLPTIDKIEQLLVKHKALTGIGGMVTRPAEAVSNVFGSDATDRKQFERYISELQEIGPRILTGSNARPLAAEAGKINTIIAGLRLGDTTANTTRAYRELKQLFKDVRGSIEKRWGGDTSPAEAAPEKSGGKTKFRWQDAPLVE